MSERMNQSELSAVAANKEKSYAWYESGQLKAEGAFLDGHQHGIEIQYYENGRKKAEGNFLKGKLDGLARQWHANGQLLSEIVYEEGVMTSELSFWDENGSPITEQEMSERYGDPSGFVH